MSNEEAHAMKAYKIDNELRISVCNFKEFKLLIERVQKETRQLQSTVNELENFDFKFKFNAKEIVNDEA